jgi:hypothetical protein
MKSVLMISPYFVPRRRVGALRTFKFAIHLKKFGYHPVVLTIKDDSSLASEAEKELLKGLEVVELSTPFDRTIKSDYSSNSHPSAKKKQGAAEAWIDRNTPSDTWIYFYMIHFLNVLKHAKEASPDLIWATGDPWSSLVLGSVLAKKMSAPLVCDFRDPWTRSGVPLRDRSSFSAYWDRKMERSVLRKASHVIFTSKSAEKDYHNNHAFLKGNTSVVYNSVNDQLKIASEDSSSPTLGFKRENLNLIFFGEFRRLSPLAAVANVLSEIRRQSPDVFSTVKVHSFGNPDRNQLLNAKKLGVENQFVFHPKVKPEEGMNILHQGDILLLSTHPNRKNIVPAKLWDYLVTDVPVLSIVPNPEVGEIIKTSNAGLHFHPDEHVNAASKLIEWAQVKMANGGEALRRKSLSDEEKFRLGSQIRTGELAKIFDRITLHG